MVAAFRTVYVINNGFFISLQNAPAYADDVLARMLGVRGEGCGVLRTCCRPAPEPIGPAFGFQPGYLVPDNMPSDISLLPFQGYQEPPIPQIPIQQITKPLPPVNNYHPNYEVQLSSSYSHPTFHTQKVIDNNYGYMKPTSQFGHRQQFLPQHINKPSHIAKPYQTPNPYKPSPIPQPSYLPPQQTFSPPNRALDGHFYGKCGSRPNVGVHGRVQNLQYHETATEFGEYPWQAAILKRLGPSDSLYVCGGTLISAHFVVTAAHCIKK